MYFCEREGVLLNCQECVVNRSEEFDAEPRPLCLVPVEALCDVTLCLRPNDEGLSHLR
jgi:hypothetical protein